MRLTEEDVKKDLEAIYGFSDNSEKLSWRRKYKKMLAFIEELKPLEEEMMRLHMEKMPILDSIEEIREEMVKVCIHPKDFLVHHGTHVECKFCNKKISTKSKR